MIKKSILTLACAAAVLSATAQDQENMYLIKGDRIVATYGVDDVDYISFKLPENINNDRIWLTLNSVGKNRVSYTVNTQGESVGYAHGLVDGWTLQYYALDLYESNFTDLPAETQTYLLQTILPYNAYISLGTDTFEQVDFQDDGDGGRFLVTPGTDFYLCAWEINPATQQPLEAFVSEKFTTQAPGKSSATLAAEFKGMNSEGAEFNISGSSDLVYIKTAYGPKEAIDLYIAAGLEEQLFGMFGQNFTLDQLQGVSDETGYANATWPADESGDYVLLMRGYDANGDMVTARADASVTVEVGDGPQINVLSRSKDTQGVSVSFEITPSNVSEAYVNMLPMNDVDDKLNMGYELYEVASSGSSTDIYDDIRANGEYTFSTTWPEKDTWYSILIYARDTDGNRIAQRMDVADFDGSEWADYNPVKSVRPRKALRPLNAGKRILTLKKK